jgi:uncharacterized delta-60 repeat protein
MFSRPLCHPRPALAALVCAGLFALIACSGGGGDSGSNDSSGSGDTDGTGDGGAPEAPHAPTGVSASSGNGQVSVSWDEVEGAAGYNIYWADSAGVEPSSGQMLEVSGTPIEDVTSPYAHDGLTAASIYYYVVTALNESGESDASEEASAMAWGTSGTLDATLSSDGFLSRHSAAGGNANDYGIALAVDSAGRIVVAGSSYGATTAYDLALWRFTSTGEPDPSFGGGDGIVTHHNAAGGGANEEAFSIAIDSAGQIVVAGFSAGGATNNDMALWRFTDSGELDTSFGGGDGFFTHHNAAGGNGADVGNAVALDSSGRIVVAGQSDGGATDDLAVWRFTSTGELDTSFGGGDGIVTHHNAAGGSGHDYGLAVTVDSSGRIVVAGQSDGGATDDLAVWRFASTGELDTAFGGDGVVTHHNAAGGSGTDSGYAVALDSSDRIVAAGYSGGSGTGEDIAVWRFTSTGDLDTGFSGDGVFTLPSPVANNDWAYGLSVSPSGEIVAVGYSYGGATNGDDLTLWRVTDSGDLDTGFDGDGIVTHHNAAGGASDDYGYALTLDAHGRIVATGYSFGGSGSNNSWDMALWRFWP